MSPSRVTPLALALFAAGLLGACAGPDPAPAGGGVAAVSSALVPSPAVARALAASLEPGGGGALEDGLVRRRVAALAVDVAAACGAPGTDLTVLDTGDLVARALPGGHLQVSRGLLLACAGPGALERAAALLAHVTAHAALGHPVEHLARDLRREGVAALPSSVAPILDGAPAGDEAAALGLALRSLERPLVPGDGCDEADARAQGALAELGLPARALVDAYAALALVEARDPGAAAPFAAAHGPPGARLRAAREATTSRTGDDARSGREPLDLTPLTAAADAAAALDAAEVLVRRGAAEAALQLVGDQRAARASTLRGQALLALGRDKDAERALRAALLVDPGAHAARLALAGLFARQGLKDAARGELEHALRRAPLDPAVHVLLARAAEDDAVARARLTLAFTLALGDGPWAREAGEVLLPVRASPPPPPPPGRRRILSGSGR